MKLQPIDLNAAHERLSYNSETGIFTWKVGCNRHASGSCAGSIGGRGYVYIKLNGKTVLAHRVAWAMMTGFDAVGFVDHRDTCRSNNRWVNLRLATRSQNNANSVTQDRNRSGFKGVVKEARCDRWRAEIRVNGKLKYLGLFATPNEAHAAYQAAAKANFGSFARP